MFLTKDVCDHKTEEVFGRFQCLAMSRLWTMKDLRSIDEHKFYKHFIRSVKPGEPSRVCSIWDYNFILHEIDDKLMMQITHTGTELWDSKSRNETEYVHIACKTKDSILNIIEEYTTFYSDKKEIMRNSLVKLLAKDIPRREEKKKVWGKFSWDIQDKDLSIPYAFIIKMDSCSNTYRFILRSGGFTDFFIPGTISDKLEKISIDFKFNPIFNNWENVLTKCIEKCLDEVLYNDA